MIAISKSGEFSLFENKEKVEKYWQAVRPFLRFRQGSTEKEGIMCITGR